ncbi:branched-chain amino acid ABC transporter permease [Natronomonas gomsonensis]|uniref:branched-chain amino acid ABC transporter permease n=1 Tax=Natronomonas gomsonensis TaxID=1046043 RepID=UPI0015BB63E5|nr:branched-chain amino acid ABC transporter permease [Natronomonas gomsonensis]
MGVAETITNGREAAVDNPIAVAAALVGVVLLIDLVAKLLAVTIPLGPVSLGGVYSPARFVSQVRTGIVVGLLFGLAGIGLSMTYSILNFANFSHGDLITTGGFAGWGVAYLVAGFGSVELSSLLLVRPRSASVSTGEIGANAINTPGALVVGLIAAILATMAIAVLIDRIVYEPMRDRGGISLLIASIGVALALRYVMSFVYDSSSRGVTAAVDSYEIPLGAESVSVSPHAVTIVILTVALMLGLHLMLQRTKLGKAMRAMADNKDLALVTGIPTERVVRATWLIGGGLTGAAGYLVVLFRGGIGFDFGWLLLLFIFAAVILGGIGSIYGAIAGGLVIGLVREVSLVWIPGDLNAAAAFAIMILVLVLRPEGIFKGVSTA